MFSFTYSILSPQHWYFTRACAHQRIENQEQENVRLRLELYNLIGNMDQIIEMIQYLSTKMNPPQVIVILEIFGGTFDPQPSITMPSTWTPFGLPPNYSSPFEETPSIVQATQHVVPLPLVSEAYPVVYAITHPIIHIREHPQFKNPHHVYHAHESSDEEDEIHEDIKGIK